jgi:hypothetical protein
MLNYAVRPDGGEVGFTAKCTGTGDYRLHDSNSGCTFVSKGMETGTFYGVNVVVSDNVYESDQAVVSHTLVKQLGLVTPTAVLPGFMG